MFVNYPSVLGQPAHLERMFLDLALVWYRADARTTEYLYSVLYQNALVS